MRWIIIGVGLAVLFWALWGKRRADKLRYLFFLRFPMLVACALLALTPLAFLTEARSMLRGLFDVSWAGLVWVTALAALAALPVMIACEIITRYASERFDVGPAPLPAGLRRQLSLWRLPIFVLPLALPPALAAAFGSRLTNGERLGGLLLGFASAYLIFASAIMIRERWSPGVPPLSLRWLPGQDWLIERFLKKPTQAPADSPARRLARLLERMGVQAGYLKRDGTLQVGHLSALVMLGVTLLVYVAIGFLNSPGRETDFPALGFLFLLVILVAWILPAVSFFLDRFRFPALLAVIVLSFLLYSAFRSDHVFETSELASFAPPPPARAFPEACTVEGRPFAPPTVLARRLASQGSAWNGSMLVVAASGGGVTAAAWAAQVLTGLEEDGGARFRDSLVAVSSVSGGSVGTMYYIDRFGAPERARAREHVRQDAQASSLAATAWGLAYPDIWRFLATPVVHLMGDRWDRASAMEQAWKARLQDPERSVGDLRSELAAGAIPVPIFNAMAVQTGEPLLVTPLDWSGVSEPGSRYRSVVGEGRDVFFVTGARLSATFPWVTPVARADENGAYHVGDGGYFDNFGVAALVEWFDEVAECFAALGGERVLVVEIRAAKDAEPAEDDVADRGWQMEVFGPGIAMLAARTTSQRARNERVIDILEDPTLGIAGNGGPPSPSPIELRRAEFPLRAGLPLSWHLTPDDEQKVRCHWAGDDAIFASRATVASFLGASAPERVVPQECRAALPGGE